MTGQRLDSILRRQRRTQLEEVLLASAVALAVGGVIAILGWPG